MKILHAIKYAKTAAVASRKVRIGTEVRKWSENPALGDASANTKFWK